MDYVITRNKNRIMDGYTLFFLNISNELQLVMAVHRKLIKETKYTDLEPLKVI